MNAPLDLKLDKAAFNRWLLDQQRKYEWKDGRVVQMNDVTRGAFADRAQYRARDPATGLFLPKPLKVAGRDQSVVLVARGIDLPLAEIYRNVPTIDD